MLRALGAVPLFAIAVFLLIRSWHPLGNGYFAEVSDSPDGLYLTMAAIGLSAAALFASVGLLIASRSFRRYGLLVVAALAVVTSSLPYVLFKWTGEPETWPWAFLVQDWIAWLRFAPRPRSDGTVIQILLAFVAIASAPGHAALRSTVPRRAHARRST